MIKKHWTPRYIKNRIQNYFFEKKNQDLPWLTPESIKLLSDLIKKTDIGLEFGSGRSTAWFANKCGFLTSVEDHESWYKTVSEKIKKEGINNVDYLYKESISEPPIESEYYKVIEKFKDNSLDFILVDGKHRGIISLKAINKVKPGGLLIIDNIERCIPCKTHSPHSIGDDISKIAKEWKQFIGDIKPWRKIMTTNGVTDTAIYIKQEQSL